MSGVGDDEFGVGIMFGGGKVDESLLKDSQN